MQALYLFLHIILLSQVLNPLQRLIVQLDRLLNLSQLLVRLRELDLVLDDLVAQ